MADFDLGGDFNLAPLQLEQNVQQTYYDDSETQDVGGNFGDVANHNNEVEEAQNNRFRKRGKNINHWGADGLPERIKWSASGVPLFPNRKCSEFSRFIGCLAAEGGIYSISVKDWRNFEADIHHRMAWERVKATIDWSHEDTSAKKGKIKRYVFRMLNERWKQHKKYLKKTFWEPNQNSDQRFQCNDKNVVQTQWCEFVKYLDDEDTKTKAAINASNRSQRTMHHRTGTRTFQAVIYEWKIENGVEEEPDRWDIFKLTHKKKGSKDQYVDNASAKAVLDFEKAEEERRKANVAITPAVREDIYAEVLWVEKRNRVRGLGAGVKWTDTPLVHTDAKSKLRTVAALEARLEEQRLQAEKERMEAAERERSYISEIQNFMAEQRRLTEENARQAREKAEENAIMIERRAAEQIRQWMKEGGFSQMNTGDEYCPTDEYCPEMPSQALVVGRQMPLSLT